MITSWYWRGTDGSGNPYTATRLLSQNSYRYDNVGQRLTNQVTAAVPNAGGSSQYTGGTPQMDGNGNVTNEVTATRTEQYGYNDLNRLRTVNYGDGQTQSYAFDPMGNRLQRQDSTGGTTNYAYDAANRLTGATGAGASAYTSDADGNTLTGGGRTDAWDSQNRLASCALNGAMSTFTYGADGLRRSMTTGSVTTDYAYDGQTMVREMRAGVNSATYLAGPRGPEYRRDDTQTETDGQGHTFGKTRWYVYDGLGSVVGEVDPLGNLTSSPK